MEGDRARIDGEILNSDGACSRSSRFAKYEIIDVQGKSSSKFAV